MSIKYSVVELTQNSNLFKEFTNHGTFVLHKEDEVIVREERSAIRFLSQCLSYLIDEENVTIQYFSDLNLIRFQKPGENIDDFVDFRDESRIYRRISEKDIIKKIVKCFSTVAKNGRLTLSDYAIEAFSRNAGIQNVSPISNHTTSNDSVNTKRAHINNTNIKGENIIVYGVPGCGKSYYIQDKYLKNLLRERYERVVFHPDYAYSDFVGQILPKCINKDVAYEFVSGPFTRIMKKANDALNGSLSGNKERITSAGSDFEEHCSEEVYNELGDKQTPHYYLIIEEINRGNAPAIFGDIFQLLDRKNGESEYEINNAELAKAIYLEDPNEKDLAKIQEAEEHPIKIPANLTILATMNTADQNVFTLDTAFKRRWKMQCIKDDIENCDFKDDEILDTHVSWREFQTKINEIIVREAKDSLGSDDKRLGAYFIKPEDLQDDNAFSEKVLLYLRNDVFKFNPDAIFKEGVDYGTIESLIDAFEKHKMDIFNIEFDELSDINDTEVNDDNQVSLAADCIEESYNKLNESNDAS